MGSKTTSTKGTHTIDYNVISRATTSYSAVSVNDAEEIASIDAPKMSSNPTAYIKNNLMSYFLIINLWIFQIDEISRTGRFELIEMLKARGLLATIALCSEAADIFIQTEYSVDRIASGVEDGYAVPFASRVIGDAPDDRVALQLLRFPKRFSPVSADLISQASVDNFDKINDKCKIGNRSERSQFWVERVRARLSSILAGFSVDYDKGFFSAGVAADADRPLADKLSAYSYWEPCLFHSPLLPIGNDRTKRDPSDYCAIVQSVPKSYKTARVIAEEHAYRQFHMQAIRLEIERCIERNGYVDLLDLHDQSPNQRLAWEGSFNPTYATIDLSAASDSLERAFIYSVLPLSVVRELDKYLPRYYSAMVTNKKGTHVRHVTRRMDMFCTSGSAVTFPIESIVFLAICLEVTEVCSRLTGESFVLPHVFGDDLLVDVAVYDTVVQVLEQLRFSVNTTKSFGWDSRYRESCGVEYFDGYALSSKYWPRSTVSFRNADVAATLGQLCSLQHALYENTVARIFLTAVVRCLEPRMTSHNPGVLCDDLWEPVPQFKRAPAPYDMTKMESCPYEREVHLVMKTRRKNRTSEVTAYGYTKAMIVQMWLYATFLRSGPQYDDDLSRLLGVTSKPPTLASLCDTGEVYWDYVRE